MDSFSTAVLINFLLGIILGTSIQISKRYGRERVVTIGVYVFLAIVFIVDTLSGSPQDIVTASQTGWNIAYVYLSGFFGTFVGYIIVGSLYIRGE